MVEKHKKILVTGAKGMLGSVLCRVLSSSYEVTPIDKEECDLADKDRVKQVIDNLAIDAVIHCAAYTEVDKAEDEKDAAFLINAKATKNILDNLKNKECLFIYISTDYVFDGRKNSPYTEVDSSNPLGVYGKTKLEGEKSVSEFKKHLILRTSWLFGPDGKNFIATILRLAKEKETLEVVNDQIGSPTYTLDLAGAIKKLLDIHFTKGLEYGIYNVTNCGECSWFTLAQYIAKTAGLKNKIKPISSNQLPRKAKRPASSLLANEKFHALAGYYLPSWEAAVKHYIENYIT